MKIPALFIIVLILLFVCNLSNSQYLPMLEEDHTWSVDLNGSNFGEDPWIRTDDISVSGSTVINGKTYKTVTNDHIPEIDCLVREENGIVYRYNESINDEMVMYDFTLEVGDSFTFFQHDIYCSIYGPVPSTPISAQVISTDIQFIAGENRKVIEFEYFFEDEEIWIEGIGSIRGFDYVGVVYDIIDFTELVCFTNNVDTYFFNGATSCDNTTLGFDDLNVDSFNIYPSPVQDLVRIENTSNTEITSIKLYDVLGRLVMTEKGDINQIDLSHLNSGLLFVEIETDKGVVTKKIIKE